jgi:ribosomal protein S18 acetylase RimI-like enzyme
MPTLESYQSWVRAADRRLMLLAWQESMLIGYVAAREDTTGVEIVDVQVHPQHQRLGVATALAARVVAEADRRKCARVWLETEGDDPVGARRFYEQLGFRLAVEHLRFRKPENVT